MRQRSAALEGLRGVASFIVLAGHSTSIIYRGALNPYLAGVPKLGVWLFFVLSAYLLTEMLRYTGFGTRALAAYFIGRASRILPLFLVAVLFYRVFGTAGIDTWNDAEHAILFIGSYAHLWTVPVEFSFYLVLPIFAAALLSTSGRSRILGTCAFALLLGVHQAIWPAHAIDWSGVTFIWYLPCFLVGIWISACNLETQPGTANLLGLLAVIILVGMTPVAQHEIFERPYDGFLADKFIFLSAIWGACIVSTLSGGSSLSRLMTWAPLRAVGRWSYPMYLIHWYIVCRLSMFVQPSPWGVVAAIVLSIGAGAVISVMIEQPMERWRKSLIRRLAATSKNSPPQAGNEAAG